MMCSTMVLFPACEPLLGRLLCFACHHLATRDKVGFGLFHFPGQLACSCVSCCHNWSTALGGVAGAAFCNCHSNASQLAWR
jgi:hypothetical protein